VDVAARLVDQLGGAGRGSRGSVELAIVMQLDDLAFGHVATCCESVIIRTAPIAKFGATKVAGAGVLGGVAELVRSKPVLRRHMTPASGRRSR
jgi:hypothetical protein